MARAVPLPHQSRYKRPVIDPARRLTLWPLALALALLACGCAPDRPTAPQPTAQLGPWLQLDKVAVQSVDDAWVVTRSGDTWSLAPGPWFADDAMVTALELALRRPWHSVHTRETADARALGVVGPRRLDVVLHPTDQPPVRLAVGDVDDCTWVRFEAQDVLHCIAGDLRAVLGAGSAVWRSERVTTMPSETITDVQIDGVRAQRIDRQWIRAGGSEPGAEPTHPIHGLALDRVLRTLAGARAEPAPCDGVPERVRLRAEGEAVYVFSLGGPGARCLSIDGVGAFEVDHALGRLLMRASRSIDGVGLPYLGTPDVAGTMTIRDADGARVTAAFDALPRNLARGITQLRASARTGEAFAPLRWARPQRSVTLQLNGGPVHRILLWWPPVPSNDPSAGRAGGRGALGAVIARVDTSPLFFADNPGALRAPLPVSTGPLE